MKIKQARSVNVVEVLSDWGALLGYGTIYSDHKTNTKRLCVTDTNGDLLHSDTCDEYVTYDENLLKIESVLRGHLKQEQPKC